jgi:ATP-dependent DNA helicase RecQ
VKSLVADEDAPLMSALKAKRRALAEAASVPAYVIFPDRTLAEMAEKRPANLDQMAQISGVGAKKLESYGLAFLAVINGAAEGLHPQRLRLAGRESGALFDRLSQVQLELSRGADGIGKPLSLSQTALRKIAEARPSTLSELDRVGDLGPAKIERFGDAFLAVLRG